MSEACSFIKRETLAEMFSCKFCEISKNTFFHRTSLAAASEYCMMYWFQVFFNLDKISFALFNVLAISQIYSFKLRFSSISIPRYFTELVG